jgi:hypothetical protein
LKLDELRQKGNKEATEWYLRKIFPDLDEIVVEELVRFKNIYVSGVVPPRPL